MSKEAEAIKNSRVTPRKVMIAVDESDVSLKAFDNCINLVTMTVDIDNISHCKFGVPCEKQQTKSVHSSTNVMDYVSPTQLNKMDPTLASGVVPRALRML